MTGRERADKVRAELCGYIYDCGMSTAREADDEATRLLPEGAVILTTQEEAADWLREQGWVPLTAEEAEQVHRHVLWSQEPDSDEALALLSGDTDGEATK